jgi:cytochrome P450
MSAPRVEPRFPLLHALAALRNPDAYFRYRARRENPFAMFIPGLAEVHLAGRADAVREFLTLSSTATAPPTPNPIGPVVGEGSIILLSAEAHRRERARLLSALSAERVRGYAAGMAQAARDEIAQWRPGDEIDVRDIAQTITLRIIIRAVFGVEDQQRSDHYVRVIKSMMRSYISALMFVPALRRAPAGLGPWGRFVRRRAELDALLSEDISRWRAIGPGGCDNVLSALLRGDDRGDEVVRQQLRTLLIAGHETSATTLTWALYHVHREDHVRRRLLADLATCPTREEIVKLPYLNAVISETLRMHPPVSIAVRQLTCPVTMWKRRRARGDVVGVALPAVHADPAVWPDPGRFSPSRFLDHRFGPAVFSPYGYGHRRCVGSTFANVELAVVMATILSHVDLQMSPQERRRRPPRSVPRGIAAIPNRRIALQVTGRR